MITHMNGDYFVDCGFASQSFLQAAFGVWINIYAAVVAFCVRSVFRSRLTTRLLSNDSRNSKVSLWVTSPATTVSDVFELREILFHGIRRRHFTFVTVSLCCVAAAVVGAASTTIANYTVVRHLVIRKIDVPGRLAYGGRGVIIGLNDRVTSRAHALDLAQAPLDQLLDFVPDDNTSWVFVPEEWNNTWLGKCAFHKYPAVDLVVLGINSTSTAYQDLVPALGTVLPSWATLDRTKQGFGPLISSDIAINETGSIRDGLATYAFGSAPNVGNESLPTVNISFANFLVHNIGLNGTKIIETAFKSDVHVAECTFNNTSPNEDQARADDGQYLFAASAVANVYSTKVAEASAKGETVVQPTAQEMLRYWQAYQMIKSGYFIHPVHRNLSVSMEVVQIRLSAVLVTTITFVLALAAAAVAYFSEPLDDHGKHMTLPKSQLDWIVEAARQHSGDIGEYKSHVDFAKEREDLLYVVLTSRKGLSRTQIMSNRDESITQPVVGHFDPSSLYDNSKAISTTQTPYGAR